MSVNVCQMYYEAFLLAIGNVRNGKSGFANCSLNRNTKKLRPVTEYKLSECQVTNNWNRICVFLTSLRSFNKPFEWEALKDLKK